MMFVYALICLRDVNLFTLTIDNQRLLLLFDLTPSTRIR